MAGIGRFLMRQGREIVFDPDPSCEPRTVGLYLRGTCFAILLQQRGNLVLHASAIAAGGRAVLFCGPSGAGKSTMAALLCRHGYPLLNDDVCSLAPVAGDTYEVQPDGCMLKLRAESLDLIRKGVLPFGFLTVAFAITRSGIVAVKFSAVFRLDRTTSWVCASRQSSSA
jgi:hypothetical protein